ncbi:MAG TPA: GTPase Era [Gammaproteobacteria bacterium]|nr:GTPase Era [Gammaproteobacteria bacterium]
MSDTEATPFRCGYVGLIGRPNVGKSTLLNRLVGQKLSITTPRPQTTRHKILGIKTLSDAQVLYVDTPGFHPGHRRALNRHMNAAVASTAAEVDVIVFVAAELTWRDEDEQLLAQVREHPRLILALNKTDAVRDKSLLLPHIQSLSHKAAFRQIIPLSGKTGDNVDRLEQEVIRLLPTGPAFYPGDQVTDRSERFVAAELIRESLMLHLGDELPYLVAVEIEAFSEQPGRTDIQAVVWVDHERHKPMVIGRQGAMLKKIGTRARRSLEQQLDTKVFVKLWVKVKEDWSDDERVLHRLGYD